MLTVTVRLLHGTIRASAEDLALTGEIDSGEWPPSPARLLAAFVAADGTRDRSSVTKGNGGTELQLLERADPPLIHASPRRDVLASPVNERFVVENDRANSTVQDYPARNATPVRPGTRLCPNDPRVVYVWPDVEASTADLNALADRAARIGYLGCADSPATVTVSPSFGAQAAPRPVWEPDRSGDVFLPVPSSGFVDVLDRFYDEWTARSARRSWYPPARAAYRSPDRTVAVAWQTNWPRVVWLRFSDSLPITASLPIVETLKKAILALYQHRVGDVPSVLHGHGFDGQRGYHLAQWLVLPDVGHSHARGRIHGAAVMLPAEMDSSVIEGLRTALWRPWKLVVGGMAPIDVCPHAGEQRPWAANPSRWRGPAYRWVSALPVVHERRRRAGASFEDVTLWCRHAGFPEPMLARLSSVPLLPGSSKLRPEQVFRAREGVRRPYSYVDLRFPVKVEGPVVLGRARQFGFGLMAPLPGSSDGQA